MLKVMINYNGCTAVFELPNDPLDGGCLLSVGFRDLYDDLNICDDDDCFLLDDDEFEAHLNILLMGEYQ